MIGNANRRAGARKAAATRKKLAALRAIAAQGVGPDDPSRGTVKGNYTLRDVLERTEAAIARRKDREQQGIGE